MRPFCYENRTTKTKAGGISRSFRRSSGDFQEIFRKTRDTRTKERAHAILLATGGEHTYQEIADLLGRSKSAIQDWISRFQCSEVESFYTRQGRGGGRPSPLSDKEIQEAIKAELVKGTWRTAAQARDWLKSEHNIERSVSDIYYWLGKLAGALKVLRPVHIKKDPVEADSFKDHFYERLRSLNIPQGSRVKVWVQDEARYGLHSAQRRCWGLRGLRIVKPAQQKYQWGYVFGALEITEGDGVFCYLPTVTLEHTQTFLEQLVKHDPDSEHVVIWDGAGFHHSAGDPRIPTNVHLIQLPAYSPELNPIERLWDIMKDHICNRVYEALEVLEEKISEALEPYWRDPGKALRLVGDGWMHTEANASLISLYRNDLVGGNSRTSLKCSQLIFPLYR